MFAEVTADPGEPHGNALDGTLDHVTYLALCAALAWGREGSVELGEGVSVLFLV